MGKTWAPRRRTHLFNEVFPSSAHLRCVQARSPTLVSWLQSVLLCTSVETHFVAVAEQPNGGFGKEGMYVSISEYKQVDCEVFSRMTSKQSPSASVRDQSMTALFLQLRKCERRYNVILGERANTSCESVEKASVVHDFRRRTETEEDEIETVAQQR